jgi:hypothetical protein
MLDKDKLVVTFEIDCFIFCPKINLMQLYELELSKAQRRLK